MGNLVRSKFKLRITDFRFLIELYLHNSTPCPYCRSPSLDAAPSFFPSTVTVLVFRRLLPSLDTAPLKLTTMPTCIVLRVQPERISAFGLPISAPQLTSFPVASSFTLT